MPPEVLTIEQIDLVINFSVPDQPESYVHRTGRTGRAGRSGRAFSLVGPRDFGQFHFLTKVLDKLEFKEFQLPSDDDISKARLDHLCEVIRKDNVEPSNRDELVAKKLLLEHGGIEDIDEDLCHLLAKIARSVLQHHVTQASKSLDEELEIPPRKSKNEGRDKDKREKPQREKRDKSKKSTENSKENLTQKTSSTERKPKEDTESKRESDKKTEEYSRIFINFGKSHQLSKRELIDLTVDFSDASRSSLGSISIRDKYSFIDMPQKFAEKFVENINTQELDGEGFSTEIAATIQHTPRPPRKNSRQSNRNRSENSARD